MKEFNTTGLCVAKEHYMVDISKKLNDIIALINKGKYFTINKARQYGKTTTIALLEERLKLDYIVISISFEGINDTAFKSTEEFAKSFMKLIQRELKYKNLDKEYVNNWFDKGVINFEELDEHITKMCYKKKVILIIDEVDKSSNNEIYLHFLGMLRNKYLRKQTGKDHTFHSVILAGVYDIRNIKIKMIKDGAHDTKVGEKIYNSPWNIATDFDIDMSFNPDEIASMLIDYENDKNTGMNIQNISETIYDFTKGYPYLVSNICKFIDEKLNKNWSNDGIKAAVKIILKERNTLFDDLFKNLESYEELYKLIYSILINGERRSFSIGDPITQFGEMFGILIEKNEKVCVSNRIFEILIYNYFIAKDEANPETKKIRDVFKYDVVENNKFNMELCLRKFASHYKEIFNFKDEKFLERNGRLVFLTYLRPLINGEGFYHIESNFLDERRMDVVVDYNNEQFIIELKIWHGEKYKENAYKQLTGYLESKGSKKGYLLTFDFRKEKNYIKKSEWVKIDGVEIFDVVV